jgi:hypothetical protein
MLRISWLPWLLLAAALAGFGLYRYGYHNGWYDRDAEMQAVIAQKNEEARQTEQKLAEVVQAKETELRKANDVIDKKQTDLTAAIRAGRVRFPAASCVQAPTNPTIALGDRHEARSQPDPAPNANPDASGPNTSDYGPSESERQTLELIAQIAADGDRAINQLNSCIAAYEEMRTTINAQR